MTALILRFPPKHLKGLHLENGTDTDHDVDILAGECRDDADTYSLISSGTVTAAIDASGANGLDTWVVAAGTWYSLWVIAKTSDGTVAGLFSTSTTEAGLTYPSGYDVARRVGYVRTDASANIYPFKMNQAEGRARWVYWNASMAGNVDFRLLSLGTASGYTDCPLLGGGDDVIAPSACQSLIKLIAERTGSSSNWAAQARPNGTSIETAMETIYGMAASNDGRGDQNFIMPIIDGDRVIEYRRNSANGTVTIYCIGYQDAL
ncbi:MAG: hypothetical protein V3S01_07910 [Dehalococcoidia bacterium]